MNNAWLSTFCTLTPFYFLRPMDFSYKQARKTKVWPVGMLKRGDKVLHHVAMQEFNNFLKKKGVLRADVDNHGSPGVVLTEEVHNAIHYGPNGMNALMRDLKARFPDGVPLSRGQAQIEINKVVDKYIELGHPGQALMFEKYFAVKVTLQ